MEETSLAENIVDAVLRELNNRKGFDWWWEDIDEVTRGELTQMLESRVNEVLHPAKYCGEEEGDGRVCVLPKDHDLPAPHGRVHDYQVKCPRCSWELGR